VQTKKGSLLETCLNVGSGIATANLTWWWVVVPLFPALGAESGGNVFAVNLIFTAVSIVRGYIWRRTFNWWEGLSERKRTQTVQL
jgi:hypothetical protein